MALTYLFFWNLGFFSLSGLAVYQNLFIVISYLHFCVPVEGRGGVLLITLVQSTLLLDVLRDLKLVSDMAQCIELLVSFTLKARMSCDGILEV